MAVLLYFLQEVGDRTTRSARHDYVSEYAALYAFLHLAFPIGATITRYKKYVLCCFYCQRSESGILRIYDIGPGPNMRLYLHFLIPKV
jgi:hypothetical protein